MTDVKFIYFFALISLVFSSTSTSQEIDFGTYSSQYSVTVSEVIPLAELDFGTVLQNDPPVVLTENDAKIISITGIEYLDVFVTITAEQYLILDSEPGCVDDSCRMSFELQASYSNRGTSSSTTNDTQITITGGGLIGQAQFPILYKGNNPPGPPPTPVYEGYDLSQYEETAYLYLYGTLTVGNPDAGSYTGGITVEVQYD